MSRWLSASFFGVAADVRGRRAEQGPSDVIRDRAAAVLASLPLCGEAEAWTQAAGRVALEAHG